MNEGENKNKILLLDDDKFLLDMYSMKFQKEGFDVKAFTNADDALNFLRENSDLNILLFDLIMPKIDGLGFMKEVKEKGYAKDAKKIVLSNQGQQSDVDKAKDLGVDGYIIKALHTPSQVVEEVKKICN